MSVTSAVPEEILQDTYLIQGLMVAAKDAALYHGVLMRTVEDPNSSEMINYAPFSLFPSPVPENLFKEAMDVQKDFNLLIDRVSQDQEFLTKALESTIRVDDFTAHLFEIYKSVRDEGIRQNIILGINRSDYMFHNGQNDKPTLKQIEINTIAASFAGLGSRIPDIHRHVFQVWGKPEEAAKILKCEAIYRITDGIAKAWRMYGSEKAVIVFVVENVARNIFDQRCLEMELWRRNITVLRRKTEEIYQRGILDTDRKLFIDGYEVAVAYLRTGYGPDDYPSLEDWNGRLLLERSRAIKCPDIATHLVGTKKVQQELTRPGVLEKFLYDNPEAVERIRATFVGLYSFDEGEEGDKVVAMAMAEPEHFVLKPQREGGGNNSFGEELKQLLGSLKDSPERSAYILMEKVTPLPVVNYLVHPGVPPKLTECVTELGIFGVYIRRCGNMVINDCSGHLLRTKSTEFADGGVAAGVAVLDSPYLV
ncbi:glutathione synthetase isoform X2 [Callorhinchus milii]|nr:glutathione synthetase isoform X2 [Callorhinchus milii]|eukprot:gi/632980113/ref/XP_007906850.1/ PREDICTED: glutathione synthetase isoform X2 [Callorhinchus milii]